MEIIQLRCPNCNAELNTENDLDTFYCKYCGTKILLVNQSSATIRAKADVHISDTRNQLERERWQHEFEVQKYNDKKTADAMDELTRSLIAMAIIGLLILSAIALFAS